MTDGQRRVNPFDPFGVPSPTAIIRLPVAEETKVIHSLVTAVLRNKTVTKPTLRAARAASDDGAPHLYATLFDRPSRPNGKSAKPTAPTPEPTPAPPAPQA